MIWESLKVCVVVLVVVRTEVEDWDILFLIFVDPAEC